MMIWRLDEVPEQAQTVVGGKARVLAQLAQAGYPVPAGFVIAPEAFENGELRSPAWEQVLEEVAALRRKNGRSALAVRSSASTEDSAAASFAGEFETVLNVTTAEEIRQAIGRVYQSRESERVVAYRQAQGLAARPEMAVIVQEMAPAALAGVLFTADPVSGSQAYMTGNFVRGLGEQLVAGEANGEAFRLQRPSGTYEGPAELKLFARALFQLGERLASKLNGPQDIEWAIAGDKVVVLQSRPITTMQAYNPVTGEWNDSRRGDYLWSNANFGEALPDVMTPLTWSLIQIYSEETFGNPLPGDNPLMGNIGGRFYVNLSLFTSMMQALGFSRERMNRESEEFFGNLPDDVAIPIIPFSRRAVLRGFVPFAARAMVRRGRNLRRLAAFTAELPQRVAVLQESIQVAPSPAALADLWQNEFEPLLRRAYQMLQTGTSRYENAYRPLRRKLVAQVGEEDANLLLSGVSAEGEWLASLGPLVGLWQVAQGEMSQADYLQEYGHRGPHEFEVSWPRPAEDPEWMNRQLATLAGVDVPALLARREAEKQAAWERYGPRFPKQVARTQQKLAAAAGAARGREAIRSEVTRLVGLGRVLALRVGELTGLGEDAFFLWLAELTAVLHGDETAVAQIAIRRQVHERFSSLPPYPALINGRFDPQAWAADPNRRSDIYDGHAEAGPAGPASSTSLIRGLPGSAGVVEGLVRRLDSVEEGYLLQPGEVLVTVTTNVGWTPLFPRAAAIVTDVGAPLSHAAIVARELGIPAVVGAGEATMWLRTGERVRVDGTRGVVERLE
ncbi:MAG: pyruvate, phosphate dikinase [Chloroflexi bacterium]|nr:pyruvate, phosphate dikinase [Chloroflexota bacterium]MCI0647263.1 pyruvate, phosphate dikinase [Chloroflexota bacterium]